MKYSQPILSLMSECVTSVLQVCYWVFRCNNCVLPNYLGHCIAALGHVKYSLPPLPRPSTPRRRNALQVRDEVFSRVILRYRVFRRHTITVSGNVQCTSPLTSLLCCEREKKKMTIVSMTSECVLLKCSECYEALRNVQQTTQSSHSL